MAISADGRRLKRSFVDGEGAAKVERLTPTVVRVVLAGRLGSPAGDHVAARIDEEMKGRTGQRLFWDLEHVEWYDSAVRVEATKALLRNRARFVELHAYATSKLVAMGVSVANMALGGIVQMHKTRLSFDGRMRQAMTVPFVDAFPVDALEARG